MVTLGVTKLRLLTADIVPLLIMDWEAVMFRFARAVEPAITPPIILTMLVALTLAKLLVPSPIKLRTPPFCSRPAMVKSVNPCVAVTPPGTIKPARFVPVVAPMLSEPPMALPSLPRSKACVPVASTCLAAANCAGVRAAELPTFI